MICKLCNSQTVELFGNDTKREYYRCAECELVFVPEMYYLSYVDEKARYDLHENSVNNSGYVKYLNELVTIIKEQYHTRSSIIDFGSGKNAVLSALLRMEGFECSAFDPLYGYSIDFSIDKFDVVVMCEVIEHLRDLHKDLLSIRDILKKQTSIIIRTQLYPHKTEFLKWWYIQDQTHINFFSEKTVEYTAYLLHLAFAKTAKNDVFILQG
jgi:hypothetical protein